jgi:type I restriction enzyme S subunit
MSDLAVTLDGYIVPDGWVLAPLADLAINPKNDIVDGPFGSNLKASEYTDSGVPILRLQNIKRNYFLDKNIKFVTKEKYEQLIRHTYKTGDILITKLGDPLGVACIAPQSMGEGVIVADLVRARLPVDQVDTKYITYLINSPLAMQQFKENTKGTTRQRVNLKFVRDLQLPIAPFEQQKRIVAKIEELFSHIDAGIEALNKAKQLLKQYRQSVLKAAVTGELTKEWREQNKNKLEPAGQLLERILQERRQKWEAQQLEQFKAKGKVPKDDKWKGKYKEPHVASNLENIPEGWVAVTASQIAEHIVDGTHHTPKYVDEGVDFVSAKNVKDWEIDYINTKKITLEEHKQLINRCHPQKGDVLITKSGTLGRVAVVKDNHVFSVFESVAVFPVIDKELSGYIALAVHEAAMGDAGQKIQKGIAVKHLHLEDLRKMEFLLPPKEELKEIFDTFDRLSSVSMKTEIEVDMQLLKAEKNKQSILASAFSGRLL